MHIYIIADMEGHPACFSKDAAMTGRDDWKKACAMLSEDLYSFSLGLNKKYECPVTVLDFHRNAFNVFSPVNTESFYKVINGYSAGRTFPLAINPEEKNAAAVLWGMHAPASSGGFIAHTVSSRVKSLKINGKDFSETQLLVELLAENGIPVIMVQGDSVLAEMMQKDYPDIPFVDFNRNADLYSVRKEIIEKALSLDFNFTVKKRFPADIFRLELDIAEGRKISKRWKTGYVDGKIISEMTNFTEMFGYLVCFVFLRPFIAKAPGFFMFFYNLYNRILNYLRRK